MGSLRLDRDELIGLIQNQCRKKGIELVTYFSEFGDEVQDDYKDNPNINTEDLSGCDYFEDEGIIFLDIDDSEWYPDIPYWFKQCLAELGFDDQYMKLEDGLASTVTPIESDASIHNLILCSEDFGCSTDSEAEDEKIQLLIIDKKALPSD